MRTVLFAAAVLIASLAASTALHAKSKAEVRKESQAVVDSHTREAVLIYNWLKHTPELSIHRMRGATENKVYTKSPGHLEAVYDGAGNLVRDGFNNGSYNHFPYDEPLHHFMYDMLPWIVWGSTKTDPTSQAERVVAYVDDLGRGLNAMRKAPAAPVDLDKLQPHEILALALFIGAIEDGGAGKIYTFLAQPELDLSAADGVALAQQLEKGLSNRLKDHKDLMALTPRPPKLRAG